MPADAKTYKDFWKSLFSVSDALRERSELLKGKRPQWDLTVQQLRLLLLVERLTRHENQNGVMLKTLAANIGVTPAAVSGMVDSLVRKKYLERTPSETDRRAIRIRISAKCLEHFQPYEELFNRIAGEIEKEIGSVIFQRVAADLSMIAAKCQNVLPDIH